MTVNIVTKVNGLKLIKSEVIHTQAELIEIDIDGRKVKFNFIYNDAEPSDSFKVQNIENGEITFFVINAQNGLGTGHFEPYKVKNSIEGSLYITFIVQPFEKIARKLTFSIFADY
ncbi:MULTISPECIES: DUF6864 domain-containing function [Acinetobacter]|jgi:hypothetical protein|uniref:DUF6864 domain-containing function n=2 Tax=Moraxellaceae TaxID=468 RepID=UPI0004526630|nr:MULTISPECIES: hypothetical protein [Acinetobacter]MDQ9822693.1 hypothetical protein [Acinetobacter sp. 163]SSR39789.1 Uncharacterised protein [Acinetobacter baumannii]AZC08060.1 hypothetical protein DKE48_011580 [Acinetobacter nosocomialis]EHU1210452.1 hypothetical protein [Acinetobacter nosocomialis]EXR26726.1 hypothetical protein J694_3098 [Acinetobacter sp. 1281984]